MAVFGWFLQQALLSTGNRLLFKIQNLCVLAPLREIPSYSAYWREILLSGLGVMSPLAIQKAFDRLRQLFANPFYLGNLLHRRFAQAIH